MLTSYVPAPLLQAVTEGRWVVIEDINMAPPDVLAALVPLLESGTLHVASRAQVGGAALQLGTCLPAASLPLPADAAHR